jgi:transposase
MSDHGEHGKKPCRRRSFTAEFKAGIVGAVPARGPVSRPGREGLRPGRGRGARIVKQAERDAGTRDDGGLASDERRELAGLRRENRRLREDVVTSSSGRRLSSRRRPGEALPLHRAEKARHGNVKRACELLKVSSSACYAARGDGPLVVCAVPDRTGA